MRWPTFLLWNALGGTAWATSVALAAYYGGKSVETVFSKVGLYGGLAAVGLIVILFAAVMIVLNLRGQVSRGLATAGASVVLVVGVGVVYVWRRRRRARARAA